MFASLNQDKTKTNQAGKAAGSLHVDVAAKPESNPIWQSLATSPASIQPKLAISHPDDPFELEADQIADQVMRMPDPVSGSSQPSPNPSPVTTGVVSAQAQGKCDHCEEEEEEQPEAEKLVQRKCASCEGEERLVQRKCASCEEEEKSVRRRKEQGAAGDGPGIVPSRIHSILRSSGQPLDAGTRSFFEPRFGRNFEDVRVHKDQDAGEAAKAINARAFTTGSDVFLSPGEYAPESITGRTLLAHELAHVVQQNGNTAPSWARSAASPAAPTEGNRAAEKLPGNSRLSPGPGAFSVVPANVIARDPPPDVNPETVQQAADVIIDALEGYTSRWDSENILAQFNNRNAATVQAIVNELKGRAAAHDTTREGMVDWLLGDLTEEDRRSLRSILIRSRIPDMRRLAVLEIIDNLEGYTSESNSADIYRNLAMFSGTELDGLLVELEIRGANEQGAMTAWLFGDLDRSNAERVRQHFFERGGVRAAHYASDWTASKIMALLSGVTSDSDSSDIVWNFRNTPADLRPLVQTRLDALTQDDREQTAEDALMEDMDDDDYGELRGFEGLTLRPYDREPGVLETVLNRVEWAEIIAEWVVCGLVGIATGILSVIWDVVVLVKDIVVAVWNLLWSLVYLLSGGAAGSSNWLAVKEFFIGIGRLFTDPGAVFDQLWGDLALDFHTIEGPFSDCRRAEFIVRKFINAIVTIILIFAAGYGAVKGVASVARGVAEFAVLAGEIGVGAAVVRTGGRALRAIGSFVTVTATEARALLQALSRPAQLLNRIGTRLRVILLAAEDEGYWRYVRRQAGRGATAARESAAELAQSEREFWRNQRDYWRERGLRQQQRQSDLGGQVDQINDNLNQNQAPDQSNNVIQRVNDEAAALAEENAALDQEVTGQGRAATVAAAEELPVPPPLGFPPSTPESMATAQRLIAALEEAGLQPPAPGKAIGVFYHRDGSVTIGISGSSDYVASVQAALEGRLPENWAVGPAVITPTDVHPLGLREWSAPTSPTRVRPGRATCSECRLSCAGRANPSPVEGMTVLQWGHAPMRFTDPATRMMVPCESCQANVDRIMGTIQVVPRTPPPE